MNGECKRCLLRESGEKRILTDIAERISRIKPQDKAEDSVYSYRLGQCRQCEKLVSGVCMQCGCYPELRAAYRNMKCPDTAGNRWKTEVDKKNGR